LRHKGSAILALTFASASIVKDVAEQFSANSLSSPDKINALLVFYFPQPCDTAINLSKFPEYQLPCISNYRNEKEVLIDPRKFFKVTEIETDRSDERCTIYLEKYMIFCTFAEIIFEPNLIESSIIEHVYNNLFYTISKMILKAL
jgi:hypothetical protein